MAFNFSTPKTATGFTLPTTNTPTTTANTGGFQLGTSAAGDASKNLFQIKPASGLFGSSSTSAQPTAATTTSTAPLAGGGFSFGATPTSQPAKPASTGIPNLSFGTPTTTTQAAIATPASKPLGTTTSTPTLQFNLGSVASSASTGGLTFAPASTATASTAPTSEPPKLSFGLGTTAALTTTSTGLSLSSTTTTSAPLTVSSTAATSATTTATSTTSSGVLTFAQLEDNINKWTIDLEEQGKFFINQAKQLNAWDTLLISNGEKILNLNTSIERVKQQQVQLDQELDFVLAQQKELEELIMPLEKELTEIPVTDIDRNQMYQFSEIIDSQLKQLSEDLKEIIEHINESTKNEETSNPITQVARILNAHMNSLQWIDQNTMQISSQLDQLAKMQEANRRSTSMNQSFNI